MKNTNQMLQKGIWNNYAISIDNKLLTNAIIEGNLVQFWDEVMNKLSDNQFVFFMFKVKYDTGKYKTLNPMQKVNKKDFDLLLGNLIDGLAYKGEEYHINKIVSVNIGYHIIPEDKLVSKESNILKRVIKKDNNSNQDFIFGGYNLPNTMDYLTWGSVISKKDNVILVAKANTNSYYKITVFEDRNEVEVLSNNIVIISFKDILNDVNNLKSFTRILKYQEYVFIDGKLIVKKLVRKTSFLKTIKSHNKISNKFLTLDLETRTIDNIITPYCVSIYDGTKATSFYLSDYSNPEEMMKMAIVTLLNKKYDNHKVYIHNLSHFDGIFLLKVFSSLDNVNVKPIMNDGKMFDIQLTFNKYHINFRDSLLILPNSLRRLCNTFNVENKGIFPYKFVSDNLDYIGPVPTFKYFNDVLPKDYDLYKSDFINNDWNLRNETIKYCEQDCRSLYQVLITFNSLIFDKFQLNIHKYPTLPSLAFAIYRCKYLNDHRIPLISGEIFHDLKKGYTGGHTDVYKPFGTNVFRYDVNSLYPFVMKEYPMPIGNITYFEGDILNIDSNAFGFFECEITAPDNLNRPLLQTKVETKGGDRTVAPLGSWKDMIFSEEMNEYLKYGYQFKVLRGYLFDKGYIFKDYVEDLYKIKQSVSKDDPMYAISKLLLNSLYGRFGMNYNTLVSKHVIIYNVLSYQLLDKHIINDIIELDNDQILVSYVPRDVDEILNLEYFDNIKFNISIGIAAAVTACARIHMSQFLGDKSLNVLYTDTDSIDIDKQLDSKFIGKELGLMKLECIFEEAVFLAPKVYGGIIDNEKSITKVKGFKNEVEYSELKSLLIKDTSLELKQDNWFTSIREGTITIKEQLYKLVPTDNKRQLIYLHNKFVNTKPFKINSTRSLK
jgi:hypothetical protein